jgi:beta-glucosidase-like glycosyl hydrolase
MFVPSLSWQTSFVGIKQTTPGFLPQVSMGALRDIYLKPWKAFAKAGGRALMASHNDINGRPCHSNPYLLTKIMREEFGFGDALIASDGHDVNRVFYTGTCSDAVDAATQCLSAGMDQVHLLQNDKTTVCRHDRLGHDKVTSGRPDLLPSMRRLLLKRAGPGRHVVWAAL